MFDDNKMTKTKTAQEHGLLLAVFSVTNKLNS